MNLDLNLKKNPKKLSTECSRGRIRIFLLGEACKFPFWRMYRSFLFDIWKTIYLLIEGSAFYSNDISIIKESKILWSESFPKQLINIKKKKTITFIFIHNMCDLINGIFNPGWWRWSKSILTDLLLRSQGRQWLCSTKGTPKIWNTY